MPRLQSKLRAIFYRVGIIFVYLPVRVLRFILHLLYPICKGVIRVPQYQIINGALDWLFMIPFYLIDVLGFSEFYEILNELVNWNIRDLKHLEIGLAKDIFQTDIDFELIRIHDSNWIAKRLHIAYVSFRQINFNQRLSNDVFIHEMVHIWQYQKFGAVYIYLALKAQRSKEGYDYGPLEMLVNEIRNGKAFHQFNFEQQAEIIQDYFNHCYAKDQPDMLLAHREYLDQMNQLS